MIRRSGRQHRTHLASVPARVGGAQAQVSNWRLETERVSQAAGRSTGMRRKAVQATSTVHANIQRIRPGFADFFFAAAFAIAFLAVGFVAVSFSESLGLGPWGKSLEALLPFDDGTPLFRL